MKRAFNSPCNERIVPYSQVCPYFGSDFGNCSASTSSMIVGDNLRAKYCLTEEHDDCPVFLAKALRMR